MKGETTQFNIKKINDTETKGVTNTLSYVINPGNAHQQYL